MEVIKGKSITIQTTQGEVRVIAFDSIDSYGLGLDRPSLRRRSHRRHPHHPLQHLQRQIRLVFPAKQ